MYNQLTLTVIVSFLLTTACKVPLAKSYDFPKPVDTSTREIDIQEKKTYAFSGDKLYFSNQFDGARLNDCKKLEDNLYQVSITPENFPINPSPYYAFKVWSDQSQSIKVKLHYENAKHRYSPKISSDSKEWSLLPEQSFSYSSDSTHAYLELNVSSDTLWVAAQELQNSTHLKEWCEEKAKQEDVRLSSIGKSTLGKNLWLLDIHDGSIKNKDIVVLLSRQHPPEVTGWFAMRAFVDEILRDNPLANAFRAKYRILAYPLMNPDGVDLGHWRHNAGGIDLNRDWAYYRQPENRQIADDIVRKSKTNKSDVVLGLDFHSTYKDVYYTNKEPSKHLQDFEKFWLTGIHYAIDEEINEKPSNVGGPVSKNWFLTQFGAIGITYEIGDETPRDYIEVKGRTAAIEMMELLIYK